MSPLLSCQPLPAWARIRAALPPFVIVLGHLGLCPEVVRWLLPGAPAQGVSSPPGRLPPTPLAPSSRRRVRTGRAAVALRPPVRSEALCVSWHLLRSPQLSSEKGTGRTAAFQLSDGGSGRRGRRPGPRGRGGRPRGAPWGCGEQAATRATRPRHAGRASPRLVSQYSCRPYSGFTFCRLSYPQSDNVTWKTPEVKNSQVVNCVPF